MIIDEVTHWEKENKIKSGAPSSLSIQEKVEVTLIYWREYRTEFHIGTDYGVSESTICRAILRVEDILIKSGKFTLNEEKSNLLNEKEEIIVIDATECEIERPKKNKSSTIQGRRKSIQLKSS